jgi:tetratricopeptide (TPR) repeat protein
MVTYQNAITIFISYDQRDEALLRELEAHLSVLRRQGLISTWHHGKTIPGTDRTRETKEQLERASIFLLLVSANFLASDHYEGEMHWMLERHEVGQARIIPIIVRSCDWSNASFAHLQVLPTDALPITLWIDRDKAWTDVATGIRRVLRGEPLLLVSTPHSALSLIWGIPFQRNRFFLGQDDLLVELHQRLVKGTATALTQIQAINGLGGIGKTQIAIEYAYRHRDAYSFVFWIRAEHRDTLIADLVSLASQFQLPEQHETDLMKVVIAVKHWLSTHQRWLLIFDNVDDLPLLATFLPGQHAGVILITTRLPHTQPIAEPLQVEQMDEQIGSEFLLRRAGILLPGNTFADVPPQHQQAAHQFCQLVGGLPLALDQAGAYIYERNCSVQDYITFYQQNQQIRVTLLQRRGEVTLGHPQPVITTWMLAFAGVEQDNPAAADLLRACAFLDPDLISEDLLRQGASCWGNTLASVADDPFQWTETVGVLLKYALVRRNRELQSLTIHRLVQTVLKDAMDEPTYHQWTERTIRAVEQVFPQGRKPIDWVICKRLLPHAQCCVDLIKQYDLSSKEATNLLHRVANYLCDHIYSNAELLYLRALAIREKQLGPEHPDTALILFDLATHYQYQSKYAEAEPLFQRALVIREKHLGAEHPDIVRSLIGLGYLYRDQGKYSMAEPLYQHALSIYERQLGPEHPDTAGVLVLLAALYKDQGKYAEAESLFQRALPIQKKNLGEEHFSVATILSHMAALYRQQGKYTEAEALLKQVLSNREQQFGSEHPHTAHTLNRLALIYQHQGKYAEAESLFQRALFIYNQWLGPQNPETLETQLEFATFQQAQGKFQEAVSLYQSVLTNLELNFGPNHPKTMTIRNALAALLRTIEEPDNVVYTDMVPSEQLPTKEE